MEPLPPLSLDFPDLGTYQGLNKFVEFTPFKSTPSGKRFLIFEGLDGSGKTEIIKKLSTYLKSAGVKVEVIRQPGCTKIGEQIRTLLKSDSSLDVATEILLIEASRIEMAKAINAKLEAEPDTVFLMDRHVDSTFVYQVGESQDEDNLRSFYKQMKGLIETSNIHRVKGLPGLPEFSPYNPDLSLTFFLDVSPEESLLRCDARNSSVQAPSEEAKDRFDVADVHKRKEIRSRYVKRILENANDYVIIDANRSFDEVFLEVSSIAMVLVGKEL